MSKRDELLLVIHTHADTLSWTECVVKRDGREINAYKACCGMDEPILTFHVITNHFSTRYVTVGGMSWSDAPYAMNAESVRRVVRDIYNGAEDYVTTERVRAMREELQKRAKE